MSLYMNEAVYSRNQMNDVMEKCLDLESKLSQSVECLEFYRDKKNMHGSKSSIVYEINPEKNSYNTELGERARQCLKQITEQKESDGTV